MNFNDYKKKVAGCWAGKMREECWEHPLREKDR